MHKILTDNPQAKKTIKTSLNTLTPEQTEQLPQQLQTLQIIPNWQKVQDKLNETRPEQQQITLKGKTRQGRQQLFNTLDIETMAKIDQLRQNQRQALTDHKIIELEENNELAALIEKGQTTEIEARIKETPKLLDQLILTDLEKPVTPLFLAIRKEQTQTAKKLIELNSNISAPSFNKNLPIHIAAVKNNTEIIQELVARGANINATNMKQATPLYLAAENGNEKAVKELIRLGANKQQPKIDGMTPLYIAAQNGHTNTVNLIREPISQAKNNGATPLYIATYNGHTQTAEALIKQGADVKEKSYNGNSPIHAAASTDNIEMIKKLTRLGADLTQENNANKTALKQTTESAQIETDLTKKATKNQTALTLISNGAKPTSEEVDSIIQTQEFKNKTTIEKLLLTDLQTPEEIQQLLTQLPTTTPTETLPTLVIATKRITDNHPQLTELVEQIKTKTKTAYKQLPQHQQQKLIEEIFDNKALLKDPQYINDLYKTYLTQKPPPQTLEDIQTELTQLTQTAQQLKIAQTADPAQTGWTDLRKTLSNHGQKLTENFEKQIIEHQANKNILETIDEIIDPFKTTTTLITLTKTLNIDPKPILTKLLEHPYTDSETATAIIKYLTENHPEEIPTLKQTIQNRLDSKDPMLPWTDYKRGKQLQTQTRNGLTIEEILNQYPTMKEILENYDTLVAMIGDDIHDIIMHQNYPYTNQQLSLLPYPTNPTITPTH